MAGNKPAPRVGLGVHLILGAVCMLIVSLLILSSVGGQVQPTTKAASQIIDATNTTIGHVAVTTTTQPRVMQVVKKRVVQYVAHSEKAYPDVTVLNKPVDLSALGAKIVQCESGGNPKARNASSAAGIAQWLTGTWNNWGGYVTADIAPLAVQEQRLAYDLGLGMAHVRGEWAASRYCWG